VSNPWQGITGLVKEIKRCQTAGASAAAVAMTYVSIDAMTYLSMPSDRSEQTRDDFIAWVDTYLKGAPGQRYQYRGLDVYAARCAILHAFSTEARLHRKDPTICRFGYHDGGSHTVDPIRAPNLVLIGIASLVNDLVGAVEAFLRACERDASLRARVEARLPEFLQTFPINDS
jgi:hypothetical protein